MTLLKATVLVVTVVVNVVHVFDVVLNVVMIIMYLVLVNKRSFEAPGSYCYCWAVFRVRPIHLELILTDTNSNQF